MIVLTADSRHSWTLNLIVGSLCWFFCLAPAYATQTPAHDSAPDSARALIRETVDILDRELAAPVESSWEQQRAAALAASPRTVQESQTLLAALLRLVRDPNTRLLNSSELEALQNELLRKSPTTGIADSTVHRGVPEGELVIVTAIAGSSAAAAGITPGDVIVSVNGSSTSQLTRAEVISRLRGEAGTTVAAGIRRRQHEFTVQLKRELNHTGPVSSSVMTEGDHKYGYVSINEFSQTTAEQAALAVKSSLEQGSSGFVLDLRRNPGGLLDSAAQVAGMFLDQTSLCEIVRRTGKVEQKELKGTKLTNAPVVVIVDEGTASAAEVVAAVLQESHRAVVVGEHTFGQGCVYAVHPLGDGSALILASGALRTPGGRSLNETGVSPDVAVDFPDDGASRGSSRDPQLAKALSCLVKPCRFDHI
jgi:carboxyl-terminal processing protease